VLDDVEPPTGQIMCGDGGGVVVEFLVQSRSWTRTWWRRQDGIMFPN
jgi:hypothetical protein